MRRSARFLFVMAIVGLIRGFGVFKKFPINTRPRRLCCLRSLPTRTSVDARRQPGHCADPAVAGLALHELGLQESVSSFLSTYASTPSPTEC